MTGGAREESSTLRPISAVLLADFHPKKDETLFPDDGLAAGVDDDRLWLCGGNTAIVVVVAVEEEEL